jgi:hypothetical protein
LLFGVIACEPGGDLAIDVLSLLPDGREVRGTGIGHHASGLAAGGKNFIELAALIGRHALIGSAMKDEERSRDIALLPSAETATAEALRSVAASSKVKACREL